MRISPLLLLVCASAFAQNVAVTFWSAADTNDARVVSGIPTNWPMSVSFIGSNTNIIPPAVLMTEDQLATVKSTNRIAFAAWQIAQATITSSNNLALISSYSNLNFIAQNWGSVTNLPTAKFAIQAEGEVLLKLRPILQQMYQGQ